MTTLGQAAPRTDCCVRRRELRRRFELVLEGIENCRLLGSMH